MLLKINQIKVPVGTALSKEDIAKKLHTSLHDVISYTIEKESLDARGENLVNSYTVLADIKNAEKHLRKKDVQIGKEEKYISPEPIQTDERPVIVGFGPSGMFAGLLLSECGCRPIIIERGKKVEERQKDIDEFFQKGVLLEESNIQYGEGGAGTFSDGKLTTRMKNIRVKKVLEELIEAGADQEIYYQNRAHIGTDVLRVLVKNIREKIISLGGEIHFSTRLESIETNNGKVHSILTNTGKIQTNHVLLCCGHSASDTYETLYAQGIHMIQKDFACGVRVEHPQALINQNQYGKFAASTQAASLAVNGMSYSQRDGKNANSAILVQIPAKDFDHGHPLDGFAFQKQLEKKAYIDLFNAPSENIKDYIDHTNPSSLRIESSYPRETVVYDMHQLFSDEVNQSLEDGFRNFDHKIPGFIEQGIMVGMESRSSSPIRILRNEDGQSSNCLGLYPCGEGAGYAGGITSAAIDGIKVAEAIIKKYKHF